MNEIESVFETSSKEILTLAKNFNRFHVHDNLLDSLMINNHPTKVRKQKTNTRFKIHPEVITSSDSDTSKQPFKNGFKNHHVLLYNRNEEKISNVNAPSSENSSYLLSPKQIVHSPNHSCSDSLKSLSQILESAPKREINCGAILNPTPFEGVTSVKKNMGSTRNEKCNKRQVDKKLLNFLQKIFSCLEDIRISLDTKIEMPDGDADWHKRQVRTSEFCSRLQRNYLYQLGRQIAELQKYTKNPDINTENKNFAHCITSAHHTLLQAFQAYHNHIPTSLGNVVIDKLRVMIHHTNGLFDIHRKLLNVGDSDGCRRKDLIETIHGRCDAILEKANEIMAQPQEIKKKKITPRLANAKKNSRKKMSNENKLSMYSLTTVKKKDVLLRRAIEALSNNKLKCSQNYVHSRYRTAGFKHRPPVEKLTDLAPKLKLLGKKSLHRLIETPFTTPKNEDEIQTMVNTHNEKKSNSKNKHDNCDIKEICDTLNKTQTCLNHCNGESETVGMESLKSLLQNLCEAIRAKEGQDVSQKQLEILLKGLLEMVLSGKINNNNNGEIGSHKNGFNHTESFIKSMTIKSLPNLFQKVDSKIQNGKINMENGFALHNLQETIVESVMKLNGELQDENLKNEVKLIESTQSIRNNWKTVAVTGEKNAQLICIRDDSSIIESPPIPPHPSLVTIETDDIQISDNKEKTIATAELHDKRAHNEKKNVLHTKKSKNAIKISRLPKQTLKKLVPIQKLHLKAILHGKLQHAKMIKDKPMYCKSSKTHPWVIVEQISEQLLDDSLLLIAEEIQVNNILESLYNSEFQ